MEFEAVCQRAVRRQEPLPPINTVSNGVEQPAKAFEIQRFAPIVERAELDGFDGRVHRRVSGHPDHLACRIGAADRTQDLEPSHLGHFSVKEGDVRLERRQFRQQCVAARASDDLNVLTLCKALDERQNSRLFVDNQGERRPVRHGGYRMRGDNSGRSAIAVGLLFRIVNYFSDLHHNSRPIVGHQVSEPKARCTKHCCPAQLPARDRHWFHDSLGLHGASPTS